MLTTIYVMYDGVRVIVAAGHAQAFGNAYDVLRLEQALHLAYERSVNLAVSDRPVLGVTMSYAYATLHYLVTPLVLMWLWKRRPDSYPAARTTLAIATLLGLLGFWLFPTAPPRMLPGFVDTLAHYHHWGWWGGDASAPRGLAGLTNEFAAMPSLHVGWSAWCGWQVLRNTARRWLHALAVAYPIFTCAVVVGTANHYVTDAVAGLAVLVVGAVLAWLAGWFRQAQGRHPVPQMPGHA